jgi:anthraniloyl-CoA monooxygenase
MQIGHAGAKGSTQLGWEIMDAPLLDGNWPLMAASDVAWSKDNQTPKAMTREDMDLVRDQFVAAAEMAERAGFDMIELHMAHGYLLSSFITPLTNRRTTTMAAALKTGCAIRWRSIQCDARGLAAAQADCRAHLGQ